MNNMGFIIMILALLIGIFLTFTGISRRKNGIIYNIGTIIGIALIVFAVILALPH